MLSKHSEEISGLKCGFKAGKKWVGWRILVLSSLISAVQGCQFLPQLSSKSSDNQKQELNSEIARKAETAVGTDYYKDSLESVNLVMVAAKPQNYRLIEIKGINLLVFVGDNGKVELSKLKEVRSRVSLSLIEPTIAQSVDPNSGLDNFYINGINLYNWTFVINSELNKYLNLGVKNERLDTEQAQEKEKQEISRIAQETNEAYKQEVIKVSEMQLEIRTNQILEELKKYYLQSMQAEKAENNENLNAKKLLKSPNGLNKLIIDLLENPETPKDVQDVIKEEFKIHTITLRSPFSQNPAPLTYNYLSVKKPELSIAFEKAYTGVAVTELYIDGCKIYFNNREKSEFIETEKALISPKKSDELVKLGLKRVNLLKENPDQIPQFEPINADNIKFIDTGRTTMADDLSEDDINQQINSQRQKAESNYKIALEKLQVILSKVSDKSQSTKIPTDEELKKIATQQAKDSLYIGNLNQNLEQLFISFVMKRAKAEGGIFNLLIKDIKQDTNDSTRIDDLAASFFTISGLDGEQRLPKEIKDYYFQSFRETLQEMKNEAINIEKEKGQEYLKTANFLEQMWLSITISMPMTFSALAPDTASLACLLAPDVLSKSASAVKTIVANTAMNLSGICESGIALVWGTVEQLSFLQSNNPTFKYYQLQAQADKKGINENILPKVNQGLSLYMGAATFRGVGSAFNKGAVGSQIAKLKQQGQLLEDTAKFLDNSASKNLISELKTGSTLKVESLPATLKTGEIISLDGKSFKVASPNDLEKINDNFYSGQKFLGSESLKVLSNQSAGKLFKLDDLKNGGKFEAWERLKNDTINYNKHIKSTPLNLDETIKFSEDGKAAMYKGTREEILALEEEALKKGIFVRKDGVLRVIYDAGRPIGGTEGKATTYVGIDINTISDKDGNIINGDYHGHPLPKWQFDDYIKKAN